MTYVDDSIWPFGRMMMCHLMADSLDELHAMARKIGIQRKWFQDHRLLPHYDVCKSKRALAVSFGAKEVTRRETKEIIDTWKMKKVSTSKPAEIGIDLFA